MPYTPEELQDVDFYQEFLAEPTRAYFDRIARSAANRDQDDNPISFQKTGVDLVSFEDITTGLGLEEGNFSDYAYNLLVSSIDGKEQQYFLNILNAEFNAYMNDTSNLQGFHAGMNPQELQGVPEQYNVTDIPDFIRQLLDKASEKKRNSYPNYKNQKLEGIIDRDINELSKSIVAESLPAGVANGNVITASTVSDTRKWLISNNQKRIFPTLQTFWGSNYAFSELVSLPLSEINKIPDGDPID